MSVHITSWVLRNSPAKGADRLMLVVLADIANHDGFCWPGTELLREYCNLADRTSVERTLDRLEAEGMIVAEAREIVGRGHKKGYRVVIPPDQLAVILGKNAAPERPLIKGGSEAAFPKEKRRFDAEEKAAPTQRKGRSHANPLRKEPLGTVTEEPSTPLSPRAGGDDFEAEVNRRVNSADEVERRLLSEHGVRVDRKIQRAIRHRIRVGETVDDLVADYAPHPPDWDPPPPDMRARALWLQVFGLLVDKVDPKNFATWIVPLVPVELVESPRTVVLAAPSRPSAEWCQANHGAAIDSVTHELNEAAARASPPGEPFRIRWWKPAAERIAA